MFRKAVISLTVWYMVIIMGISLGFSVALFQVFGNQLTYNESRQEDLLRRSPFMQFDNQGTLMSQIQNQLDDGLNNVRFNLLYFNLIILLAGGAISYFLARRTLHPIQEATEAQNRFTADASHELRTPLTAVRTELEVALRDPKLTLAESKELHRSTLEEIEKLEALSGALLRLSHHDQAANRDSFVACSVPDILNEAVGKVRTAAESRKITIVSKPIETMVEGDFWSLSELFTILLDNAVKYSPASSEIQLRAEKLSEHRVRISVEDQGPGINSVHLPHIFERFYRVDQSRTGGTASGYGLGLSIAKKIVELHQGEIEVTSTLGHGSAFNVTLPRKATRNTSSEV